MTSIGLIFSLGFLLVPLGAAPGAAERAPSHYFYNGESVALDLDQGRLLVQLSEEAARGKRTSGLIRTSVALESIDGVGPARYRMLTLQEGLGDVSGAYTTIEELAQSPDVDFVSPVFDGVFFGWLGMTTDLLVRIRPEYAGEGRAIVKELAPQATIQEEDFGSMAGVYLLRLETRNGFDVLSLANELFADPRVKWAEPDMQMSAHSSLVPNDPGFPSLWGILNTGQFGGTPGMDMGGDRAWDVTTGDSTIIVMILDNGVQQNHPDINQLPGGDFTGEGGGGGPFNECDNHGTPVAGCVSAAINNSLGTVGIAPQCKTISARVAVSTIPCDGTGSVQSTAVVNALAWGEFQGARVSNFSWSLGSVTQTVDDEYQRTHANGMVHFASAGNDNIGFLGYPSSLPIVNSLGALQPSGARASFSNWGDGIAFTAPGVSVYTTDRTGGDGNFAGDYGNVDGTSFSAPYAAGVAALILSLDPTLTSDEVESRMKCSAIDLGGAGYDNVFGWGLVNAASAFGIVSIVDSTNGPLGDAGNAAAIAWGDYDNDGDGDLYISNTGGANKLLENQGDGSFNDVTTGDVGDASDGAGAAWGDYDDDGDLDLYLASSSASNRLFRNDGGGLFADVAAAALSGAGDAVSVSWIDADLDGDVDLHLVLAASNALYRNDGGGSFADIASGTFATTTNGRGVAWGDYDNDGDLDLYITRAVLANNALFQNNGDGTFTDVTASPLGESGGSSRAAAWSDYDRDGDLDLYVVNDNSGASNKLFRNEGGSFADVTGGALADAGDGRSVAWGDYNNDGNIDLFVGNASPDSSLLIFNTGRRFADVTTTLQAASGRSVVAAAWEDFDGDGFVDLYQAGSGGANALLRTVPPDQFCNHWIQVELEGTHSNSFGVGARIRVVAGGESRVQDVTGGAGSSQQSMRSTFGIGHADSVDTLEVLWPSGIRQVAASPTMDAVNTVTETYVAPAALLLSPDGGEDWGSGTTRQIMWTSTTAVGSDYTIEYSSNGGVDWNPVTSGSGGQNSSYPWVVPNDPTTQARVRIILSNVAGSDIDTSDADFTITSPPVVDVTFPDGGETLDVGLNTSLTWGNSGGTAAFHTVEFSTDSGATWTAIVDSAAGAGGGSVPWTVPNFVSAGALVRVELINSAGAFSDTSSSFFSIAPPFNANPLFADVPIALLRDGGDGQGVVWADQDEDGDLDLYLSNSDGANKLFENQSGTFVDATTGPLGNASAGYGVAFADYDDDGDGDFYLANNGANVMIRNEGSGTFSDATSPPLGHSSDGRAVAWGDYDRDGDVDLYVANHNSSNRLFRNNGGGSFTDVTSGQLGDTFIGWSAEWVDYDDDGDPDAYLVKEGNNEIYVNNGDGSFGFVSTGVIADAGAGRGSAWGDYDNDGDLDVYISNDGLNRLLRNEGGGTFADVTTSPLESDGPSTGTSWGDVDNDGDLDLYVAGKSYNRLFRNEGGALFVDAAGEDFSGPGNSRGVTWGDYDGDGDLDLYAANLGENRIYRNDSGNGNHWLHVKLTGTVSNTSAIGSRVRIVTGGSSQLREISGGSSYLSQNSLIAEFGVGATLVVDSVVVTWPTGKSSSLTGVAADQEIEMVEPLPGWVDATTAPFLIGGSGQGVSWGDYDGDGDEDLYLTYFETANQLMRNDGGFFSDVTAGPVNDAGPAAGSVWGDYDNDGDLDLYLVNLGVANVLYRNDGASFADVTAGPLGDTGASYQAAWGDHDNDGDLDLYLTNAGTLNKLMENDGSGNFTDVTSGPLGGIGFAFSSSWGDYDDDGDLDIYVGNGFSPNQLLQNQGGGTFTDVTAAPLGDGGTAYGVAWGDYDNDGDLDLYVTNLGSANKLFRNDSGAFADVSAAPVNDAGGGYGAAWGDYDNDGDLDLYLNRQSSNKLFRNEGSTFADATDDLMVAAGGGTGVAWSDFDGDGDLDLALGNSLAEKKLLRNDAYYGNHWIHVQLVGTDANRSAIGARVTLFAGGSSQIREISGGSGFASQNSLTAEFGLGAVSLIDSITVAWPGGAPSTTTAPAADQLIQIVEPGVSTGVEEAAGIPKRYMLHANAPNPFNPITTIRYDLPRSSRVELEVYDITGRLVKTLVSGEVKQPGRHDVIWNGSNDRGRAVASGLYFYRLRTDDYGKVRKMMLVR